MPEKYATKARLDTTDHGRFIRENREALIREEADRICRELRQLRQTLEAHPHLDDVREEIEQKEARLEELEEMDPRA